MVDQKHLDYENGWPVWDVATPPHVGRGVFHERLRSGGLGHLIPSRG